MRNIDYFDRQVRLHPDRAVLIANGQTLTYGEVHDLTHRVAGALLDAGLAHQEAVAVMSPNHPGVLVAMLSFMYRYIFIMWEELARLRHARDARDFGRGSLRMRWMGNAQLIGLLLLRAMERAERTHCAMLARGWDGSVRFLGDDPRSRP